ncbi:hypothetical protein Hanom_Chr02g00119911 [Helianthus anomalus]
MMGQVAAPSESEVDLGVFAKKPGNILEKLYEESSKRKDLKGKGPEEVTDNASTEKVPPPIIPRVVIQERTEGLETDAKSSEATLPQGTRYTRRTPFDAEERGHLNVQGDPEFERVEIGGSWTTHNPACDNLPYIPRWNLVQRSRMDSLDNCHGLYSMSLPPAERLYQKNRDRFRLLDHHVCSGANFFATTQENVHEWRSMGEGIMEFEIARREFAAEWEAFNAEKKGLNIRVLDAGDKLVKEQKLNTKCQEQ